MKIKSKGLPRLLVVIGSLSCAMLASCGSTGDVQKGFAKDADESPSSANEEVVELGDWSIRLEQRGHGAEWVLIDLPNDPHDLRLLMQDGEIDQIQVRDDGERDGAYITFYSGGVLETAGSWDDGKKKGVWTTLYPDGSLKRQGNHKNGEQDGEWLAWHENGRLANRNVFDSEAKTWNWEQWTYDGSRILEVQMKDGKFDGICVMWWGPSGAIDQEQSGMYREGTKIDDLPDGYGEDR